MGYLKEVYHLFKHSEKLTNKKQTFVVYVFSSLVLAATSAIMTIMNLQRDFRIMAAVTAVLTAIFLLCAYLYGVRKMETLPSAIAAVCVMLAFSYFAVSGQNEGFAILWILLVPFFAVNIFEMQIGISLTLYFLIFNFVLFYTPLKVYVVDHYTESFVGRFPMLYLCGFMISLFTSIQKEFYSRKLYIKSNMDELTNTYNRSYFTHFVLQDPISEEVNTCVMIIDINGLKNMNDTFGHEAGDELICAVPYCCHKGVGSEFTLCRVGGDEFVLILHQPAEEIASLADKIKTAGASWQGKYSQGCRMSIGWASSSEYPQATVEELYRMADIAMYQDKAEYYQQQGKYGRS